MDFQNQRPQRNSPLNLWYGPQRNCKKTNNLHLWSAFLSLTTLLGVLTLGVLSQNKIAKSSDFAPARSKWRRLAQRRGNTWSLSIKCTNSVSESGSIWLQGLIIRFWWSNHSKRHWSLQQIGLQPCFHLGGIRAPTKQGNKIVKGSWTAPCLNIAVG